MKKNAAKRGTKEKRIERTDKVQALKYIIRESMFGRPTDEP
jgi:hypothetical protein